MGRNSRVFILLCILICILGAVAGYALAGKVSPNAAYVYYAPTTPTVDPTRFQVTSQYATQAIATIQAIKGRIIFQDPYVTSPDEENNESDTISNTDKGLMLTVKQPDIEVWTLAEIELPSDVDVSVTAQGVPPDPCDAWSYHLDFRQQVDYTTGDSVPFYAFEIYDRLVWRLEWYTAGHGSKILAQGNIDPGFDIHQPNTIRVVAVGTHIDLYINDKKVGEVDDPEAKITPENQVGVGIDTCSTSVTTMFTNLVAKTP